MSSHDRHAAIARRFIDGRTGVDQVAVSPDGSRVAYVVSTIDLAANTTRTRIWLDGAPLTAGDHDANPTWSPCGRWLAFTARPDEADGTPAKLATIAVLAVAGPGERRTLAAGLDGPADLAWSPDGQWLAFTARTRDPRYEAKDASWQAPRKVERFFGRLNGEDWTFDRPRHLHVVAADGTGPGPRNLTPGPFEHTGAAWLADSSALVTSAARHGTWDLDRAVDLHLVPLGPGGGAPEPASPDGPPIRPLTATDGIYHRPAVSPDGTRVAFVAEVDPDVTSQNPRVGVLPVTAEGAPASAVTWASAGLDRPFSTTAGAPPLVWADDATVLAVAEDRGCQHLYRLAADGSADPVPLTTGPLVVTSLSAAGGRIATVQADVTRPGELFVGGERRTRVTDRYARDALGWERFAVPTTDGTGEIDAWIMRPADGTEPAGAAPGTRYPVLLNVHGGPHTQYGETFFDEAQMQAAAGFVVVMCNPRGSSGRHTAWGQAITGPDHPRTGGTGWASVDVDDILAVIDAALARYPFCDPDRVGMLGGSYGGYMASWLASHHGGRFRALCSERAVNNLTALDTTSDIATWYAAICGQTPQSDPEGYRRRSPITHVERIDRPLLILHSEQDWRCPIAQAEELWVALRRLGKEVDFYRFPGENHELSRSGSPLHRVQRAEIILDWFAAHLTP